MKSIAACLILLHSSFMMMVLVCRLFPGLPVQGEDKQGGLNGIYR